MKAFNSLRHLVISDTRLKLINIFYSSINELFYVRQLVRLTKEEINSVRRELENLKSAGLVLSENRGNRLYYCVNRENFLTYDLVSLANKNTGIAYKIQKNKSHVGKIDSVFYSLNFATKVISKNPQDVDVVIVGNISIKNLDPIIKEEEIKIEREINYMVMDRQEFLLRIQKRDSFLIDFLIRSPLTVLGNLPALTNSSQ